MSQPMQKACAKCGEVSKVSALQCFRCGTLFPETTETIAMEIEHLKRAPKKNNRLKFALFILGSMMTLVLLSMIYQKLNFHETPKLRIAWQRYDFASRGYITNLTEKPIYGLDISAEISSRIPSFAVSHGFRSDSKQDAVATQQYMAKWFVGNGDIMPHETQSFQLPSGLSYPTNLSIKDKNGNSVAYEEYLE